MNRTLGGFGTRAVHLDNRRGGMMAADHLVDLGHRRLATITGPRHYFEARDRADGFRDALGLRGLTLDPGLEREGSFVEIGGFEAMESLLRGHDDFTGVFCHNDETAAGALDACRRHGVSVPGDISIIGFDDSLIARFLTPRLTTVRQPLREMGAASARLAHALATSADDAGVTRIFDPEIVARESTGPPPATARTPRPIAFPMADSDDTTMTTMNFLNATLERTHGGFELVLPSGAVLRGTRAANLPPPGRIVAGLEPEHLRVGAPWEPNAFLARVERIEPDGARNLLELDVVGNRVAVIDPTRTPLEPGVTVALVVDPEHVHAFARQPDA